MNKFITLVFLTTFIQLSTSFARESTGEILTTKKTSKLSYILPFAKISIGTWQILATAILQAERIRHYSILRFFENIKNEFRENKESSFCTINMDFSTYITGGFLINNGIQNLKKIK